MSEFRVLPWEFFELTEPTRVELQLSGAPRVLECKSLGGHVYFRLAGDGSRMWATTRFDADPNAERAVRRAIANSEIGRVWEHSGHYGFYALIKADGNVWSRDFYATRWQKSGRDRELQRYVTVRNGQGIWCDDWEPPRRRLFSGRSAEVFLSAEDRALTATRWLRGSAKEFNQLICGLVWAQGLTCRFPIYACFYKNTWNSPANSFDAYVLPTPHFLVAAVLDNFNVTGLDWFERSQKGEWGCRASAHLCVVPEQPSAHERLEAMWFAREWLRGKVSEREAQELLGS